MSSSVGAISQNTVCQGSQEGSSDDDCTKSCRENFQTHLLLIGNANCDSLQKRSWDLKI